ncbi:MAG TPA: glycosyltransferase family 4 protein [Verrucomicrobiae bacterium]|nr:glycosyltransferase family 4 protein [Verrucomicrobiae bacterium]
MSSFTPAQIPSTPVIAAVPAAAGALTLPVFPRPIFCHFTLSHSELKSRTFHRQCLPLAAAGFQVRYLSPAGCDSRHAGIELVRLPRRTGRLRRILAWPRLLVSLHRQRAALYHFQDPELLPIAFALKKILRKRVLYDAYEDFPAMALQSSSIPRFLRPLVSRGVAAIERLAARSFDGIVTADPLTLRRLARAGNSRKVVLYNFPNLDFFPPPAESLRPKEFELVYRGGLSERAGTYLLLEAVRILRERGRVVRLLLIGYADGASSECFLRDRISAAGLAPFTEISGRIPHERMASALARARIGVSPLLATSKFQINIPVKVFEYWACGLPVISSDLRPVWPFFRSVHAGLLFPAGDAHALALSIQWLLDHRTEAESMGRAGRAAIVQRFYNRGEAARFSRFCRRIIAE